MRAASAIMLATAILTGAALVRGITWSMSHSDRFATASPQELPVR